MLCGQKAVSSFTVGCAKTCSLWPEPPIADYTVINGENGWELQVSEVGAHTYSWEIVLVATGERILYLGQGGYSEEIPYLSNGATYGNLILGHDNMDIFYLVDTSPVFYNGEILGIGLTVADVHGRTNKKTKYFISR